jgi:hypothetical protein
LLSLDIKETATLTMICDDALGGSTAIDSRKFADEFVKRRQADVSGVAYASPVSDSFPTRTAPSKAETDDQGWTSVGGGNPKPTQVQQSSAPTIASENKFVVVGKSGKKKKSKK